MKSCRSKLNMWIIFSTNADTHTHACMHANKWWLIKNGRYNLSVSIKFLSTLYRTALSRLSTMTLISYYCCYCYLFSRVKPGYYVHYIHNTAHTERERESDPSAHNICSMLDYTVQCSARLWLIRLFIPFDFSVLFRVMCAYLDGAVVSLLTEFVHFELNVYKTFAHSHTHALHSCEHLLGSSQFTRLTYSIHIHMNLRLCLRSLS